jgi:hypothetical protein
MFLIIICSEGQETGVPENARKKIFFVENNHFIHFQLQNNASCAFPQILSKVKLTLGKSFLFL